MNGNPYRRMPALRELGVRVRRARMRLPVVPTQAQAGELIERSRRWWQELEAGRLDPQLGDLERVAALLEQPLGELLGLDGAMAGTLRPEVGDTRRRTFLAAMTMLPATFDVERLAAALGVPRAIDRRVLDDLEAQGHEYGRMYWSLSPGGFWPTVYGYAAITRHLHEAAPADLERQSGAVASRAASLLGMVAHRLHRRADAVMYLNLAAELADEANDGPLRAHGLVALRAVYSPVTNGEVRTSADRAVGLLSEADEAAGTTAPPLLRTWLYACRAEDHAVLGHTAEAERDLEAAEWALAQASDVDRTGGFFHHWNAGRLAGFRGNCYVLLRQPDRAVPVLEAVARDTDRRLVGPYTAVLTDLAAAHAQRGEVERACSLLSGVLATAERANVPERAGRVARIRARHLARWPDAPPVRQLDAQLEQFAAR